MDCKAEKLIAVLGFSVFVAAVFSPLPAVGAEERIRMATTSSTENSGLLYVLLPPFEEKFNLKVDVIAVGTGRALKLGENGDVDVVLVHSPEAEEEFVARGFGVNRRQVMYNDFVVGGPPEDPAGIKSENDAAGVFKKLAHGGVGFVSRGDDSGTHKNEKALWKVAGIEPGGKWYIQTGQGMGATLRIADEKKAYCLTDRGTFIAYQDKIRLVILFAGDSRLHNPYSIIAVNPARHPHVNYVQALTLIGWLTSPEGQRIIAEYRMHGQVLFHPLAVESAGDSREGDPGSK